jgi:transcriptional regulator with XRE-family HTH domain
VNSKNASGFGQWLRQFRKEKGYSQDSIAQVVGVTQATISAVELGQAPTLPFIFALSQAFELDERVLRTQAGLADEPMTASEQARAELLSIFDRLDEEDQLRLIENAKALRTATQKLREAPKRRLKPT